MAKIKGTKRQGWFEDTKGVIKKKEIEGQMIKVAYSFE